MRTLVLLIAIVMLAPPAFLGNSASAVEIGNTITLTESSTPPSFDADAKVIVPSTPFPHGEWSLVQLQSGFGLLTIHNTKTGSYHTLALAMPSVEIDQAASGGKVTKDGASGWQLTLLQQFPDGRAIYGVSFGGSAVGILLVAADGTFSFVAV